MSTYDYGNARVRAMKSRLLSPELLLGLISSQTIDGMLGALMKTAYRPAVEAALVRLEGLPCLAAALRRDISANFTRLAAFYPDEAGRLVTLLLRRYTVENVKTILRGLSQQAATDEILAAVNPVGDLSEAELQTLAGAADPREAIDLLATWQSPLATPLLAARGARPNAPLAFLENALDQWLTDALSAAAPDNEIWHHYVQELVDEANLMTALRLVGVTDGAAHLNEFFLNSSVARLHLKELLALTARPDIKSAVATMTSSPYAALLEETMTTYGIDSRLSEFERAVYLWRTRWAARQIALDPLGIGVVLGYMALKVNEVINLRLIGQGIVLLIDPETIHSQLLLLDRM